MHRHAGSLRRLPGTERGRIRVSEPARGTAAASDERKTCEFQEGSPFLTYPLHDLEQFLPTTREIALRLFQYMRIYPDIPAADVLMMQAEIDEQPHFVLLKLNYKESYIHFLQNGEEEKRTSIVRQRTVLPAPGGKGGETFLLNMATGRRAGHREKVRY